MFPRDCWKLSLTHFNLHKGKPAYGPGAPYLHRGMAGHFRGKVGFRRQTKLRVRIHDLIWPVEPVAAIHRAGRRATAAFRRMEPASMGCEVGTIR